MALESGRFSEVRWLQNVTCIVGMVGAVVCLGLGVMRYSAGSEAVAVWLLVAGGFWLFVAILAMTLIPLALKMESSVARQLDEVRDLSEVVARQVSLLQAIAENTGLSDAAKSLAHREQEIETLRAAIREDHRSERWDAALGLIDEMERRFGYKEEADGLREELDQARGEAIDGKLREAIALIEVQFKAYEWDRAQLEIDRLLQALPDSTKVLALQDRMAALKESHKHELMLAWDEAVRRSDTDHAIDVLKELDQYLSSSEAQALRNSARDVFKEKLLQMGVQFRFAVTEKRWQDALSIGLELIREFPNARMAAEVRDVLDTLRERARVVAESEAGQVAETRPE